MPKSLSNQKIQERLKVNTFKLESLLEITKAINNNLPQEKLFNLYENILKKQLNIGKLLLLSYNNKWEVSVKYGWRGKKLSFDIEKDLLPIDDITYVTSKTHFAPFDIIIPVFHKKSALAYVLIGDFDEEHIAISPTIKHLPFIQTLTNIIAVAAENKRLAKESIKQQALKKELELAKEVQEMLFPETLNLSKQLSVAAKYIPHHDVGGDYYDFIKLNENEFAFCLADVSGKGISAALLMSNFQANLRALLGRTNNLTELIHELNTRVLHAAKGERFITFFIGVYNLQTKVLNYVNAAHLPPIIIKDNQVDILTIGCTGLGMVDDLPSVSEGYIKLKKDSILFLYTDGVNELQNEKGEEFSHKLIEDFLLKNSSLNPLELNESLLQTLIKFKGKNKIGDDVTMLCCKVN